MLRAEQVAYRYVSAPRDRLSTPVSLELAHGASLLLSGPSGSGKSTLARCLTGLIPHLYRGELTGEVWLDGCRTTTTPLWQLMERAGLVFQNPAGQMLAGTVEEEILFGLENLGLRRTEMSRRLEDALARFGLDLMRRRAPRTLSGGEQQKLALASIMARRPGLLVLDEPLSMLDTTAASALAGHLAAQAADGTALVICEHRPEYLAVIPGLQQLALTGDHRPAASTPAAQLPFRSREGGAMLGLQVTGLRVSLGGHAVLENLDLDLAGGEITAIVGRNGVGKTTLVRALAGLQRCEGKIVVQGRGTVTGGRPELGLAFQNADLQLFNATVREEILYKVAEPDLELYAWLLQALGLGAYEETPPLLLSEGEKKRVALATIVMRQPRDGLLLDEPALGQDLAHKAVLMAVLRELANTGRLAIFTTHDLALAAQADRLLLLGPGRILADGPPERVFQDDAAWAAAGLALPGWLRGSVVT